MRNKTGNILGIVFLVVAALVGVWLITGLSKASHDQKFPDLSTATDGLRFSGYYTVTHYEGTDTEVVIPEGIVEISAETFKDCSFVTSIIIPNSVTVVGEAAFDGCSALRYNQYGNALYLGNEENPFHYLAKVSDTSITSCTIHPDTKVIGAKAFPAIMFEIPVDGKTITYKETFKNLTNIIIPDNVKSIGYGAFEGCTSLESMTLPFGNFLDDGPDNFMAYIFGISKETTPDYSILTSIKHITITGGTSIGDFAFRNCTGLTSITIPDNVTIIGEDAFAFCTSLTSIAIPNSVTSIGEGAFLACEGLTSVTLPDSITNIGTDVFRQCTSLSNITIPDSVTSIGDSAFALCTSLSSITIPNNVTSIANCAFNTCSNLISVTIPDSVTYIGDSVFEGDRTNLIYIYYTGTEEDWAAIEFEGVNPSIKKAIIHYNWTGN